MIRAILKPSITIIDDMKDNSLPPNILGTSMPINCADPYKY